MRAVPAATLAWLALAACGSGTPAASPTTLAPPTTAAPTVVTTTTTTSTTTTVAPTTTVTVTTTVTAPSSLAGAVIVVDPGHNGANASHPPEVNRPVDAGGFPKACNTTGTATDDGVTESSINLAVALAVRDRLTAAGATVILTRSNDDGWGPCIDQRGQTAARNHAVLLVSIHADGGPPGGSGFHVIHPGVVAGYTGGSAAPSAKLAVAVRDALAGAGFIPADYIAGGDGLDERTDVGTLNRAETPALMVELGNLRNTADASLLAAPNGQARAAEALVAGIATWLGRVGPS
ncbi:MAG: N-acetylmuramoyl-L-alanine amidase [Acidimicrobiales bacterium]